jgi:hypothetical protein
MEPFAGISVWNQTCLPGVAAVVLPSKNCMWGTQGWRMFERVPVGGIGIGMPKSEKKTTGRAAGGNGSAETLGPHSEIGRKLKQYYDELITEEVPERFTILLRQLEEKESDTSGKKDNA